MASAEKTNSITLTLSEIEAGVMLGVTAYVAGNEEALGRRETSSIAKALERAGVTPIFPRSGELCFMDRP